jgi:hypothetical protein
MHKKHIFNIAAYRRKKKTQHSDLTPLQRFMWDSQRLVCSKRIQCAVQTTIGITLPNKFERKSCL